LATAPVFAQGQPPTDNDVNAIAGQLYCPVCENTPLDVCPTQACAQWRDLIRLMLSQGKSEAEIKQYFVDNYGARVLNEPPREGINWLAYIVPPVVILLGPAGNEKAFPCHTGRGSKN
jgi:cytochrome c-type biogenesis protein CcmH